MDSTLAQPSEVPVSRARDEAELHRLWRQIIEDPQNKRARTKVASIKTPIIVRALSPKLDKITFARVYNELIHSGEFTFKIIKLEMSYWPAIKEMIDTQRAIISAKRQQCSRELDMAVAEIDQGHTHDSVSALSARHSNDIQRIAETWHHSIEALKDSQRDDFYGKLLEIYREYTKSRPERRAQNDDDDVEDACSPIDQTQRTWSDSEPSSLSDNQVERPEDQINPVRLEESYTINLGTQLRSAHNLRVLAVDSLAMVDADNKSYRLRTQTAMTLYSSSLIGVVLLVDSHFESYSGLQHQFKTNCESLTEFHFDSFSKQLNYIKTRVMPTFPDRKSLQSGDCYITRHSNLSNAHVVFHLVTDDRLKNCEIESQDPVMNTLRNILRIAHAYDIKTLSIPLLLVDEMDEETLSVEWCLKRAELVLKRVKGFLIEMATLSTDVDAALSTIQFLVPKGISDQLFSSLTSLIPQIFRLSSAKTLN